MTDIKIPFGVLPPEVQAQLRAYVETNGSAHVEGGTFYTLTQKECGCREIIGGEGSEPDMARVVDSLIDTLHRLYEDGLGREVPIARLIEQRNCLAYLVPHADAAGDAMGMLMARGTSPASAGRLLAEMAAATIASIPGRQAEPEVIAAAEAANRAAGLMADVCGVPCHHVPHTAIVTEGGPFDGGNEAGTPATTGA